MEKKEKKKEVNGLSLLRTMESNHKPLVILRCKLVIVGDACVGKTALSQVFQTGGKNYPKSYMMTIGAEFGVKQIPIENSNAIVELYMFDCAGQSIFNQIEMNAKYYENASAVMVVYDVSNMESLQSCSRWLSSVRDRPSNQRMIGALVGNKCDFREGGIDSRADVVKEDAHRLAADLGVAYFETSAASNIDVEAPFKHIAYLFYQNYDGTVKKAEQMSGMMGI